MKKIILIALLAAASIGSANAQCSTQVREAFGGTASMALYNTYITIGAVADAYVSDMYDAERVNTLMTEQIAMMDKLVSLLEAAESDKSGSLTADDKLYMREMIDCIGSLKGEAEGLLDVALTGSEDGNAKYNTNRDKAWEQISELLGF